MRSEYSKWFWTECDELNKDTSFAHSLAEKAWDYQQSKVDELKKHLDEYKSVAGNLDDMYVREKQKTIELQKRVDTSLKIINDIQKNGLIFSQYSIEDIEQALKGGEA